MKQATSMRAFTLILLTLTHWLCASSFKNQPWAINTGPLFNFARYNFNNDADCCTPCNTSNQECETPKIQGYLAGLHFNVTHARPSHWFFTAQFDGEWNAGYVNNTKNTFLHIKDYRPETDLGYTFFIQGNKYFITPFSGLGFYYLSTEFKNEAMTNRYYNLYVPIGFNATWNVHPECFEYLIECFTVGICADYRIDAWTRLRITTDDDDTCSYSCKTSCNKQCTPKECYPCDNRLKLKGRTQGFHVEIPMTWYPSYKENVNFQATLNPFFDWNRFGSACETNCDGTRTPVPQLNRWYLGMHAQLGVRF